MDFPLEIVQEGCAVVLAAALRPWLAAKPAGLPLWPGTWHKRAFKMIAADLAVARAAWIAEAGVDTAERQRRERSSFLCYRDEEGRVLDFHSTRHSYITMLAKSGAMPRMTQELARHSSIDLTMNHYTHLRLHDQAAAGEALPSLLSDPVP
jgi:integrase